MSQPVSRHTQHQGHARLSCRALPRVSQRPYAVSQGFERRIAACIAAILRHKSRPQPRYNFCIATPSSARPRMRAAARPYARACRIVALPGRIARLYHKHARPYRGPYCMPSPASPTLCHNTIHCIVTQMGSSPFRCQKNIFFFSSFFVHSSYWKTTKKFFFSFSCRTK